MTAAGFVGADPAGLHGLADLSEQYAFRVRTVGIEVVRALNRSNVAAAGTSPGWLLAGIERDLAEMTNELRWRARAVADAQNIPVDSSWSSRWFLRARAEFAALGVFETGRCFDSYLSFPTRPSGAEFGAMTPVQVSLAFGSMAPSLATAIARSSPELVGSLDGAPPEMRYLANRLLIESEIHRLQTQIVEMKASRGLLGWFDPDHRIGLLQVSSLTDAVVDRLEDQIAEYRRWVREDRQILLFDPVGDGRVVEVFGDLGAASRIAVVVPGIGNQLTNFNHGEGGFRQNAAQLYAAASDVGEAEVATIAWLGYDTPDGIDAVLKDAARQGATSLRTFLEGIDPQSDRNVTVVAHSYGSVLAGLVAKSGIEADNLVFVGSPGTTLDRADDANLRPGGRVWAALASNDPIGVAVSPQELPPVWVPPPLVPVWFMFHLAEDGAEQLWHGIGPTADEFGALRITTDGSSGHSDYFEAGSLANLARITQGLYGEVGLVD
ncbi:MAG: alpha/beta fold hydrolase [Actinomycetota bacterium]|nr:alpha/beta fold hydrolase [Actinomycetota bacterium]